MLNVLLDTGATGVGISQRIPERLYVEKQAGDSHLQRQWRHRALYDPDAIRTTGRRQGHNVAAVIAPRLDGDVLLGMSFLALMDVRLFQGKMTITPVEE